MRISKILHGGAFTVSKKNFDMSVYSNFLENNLVLKGEVHGELLFKI